MRDGLRVDGERQDMRERLFTIIWSLLWPVRSYLTRFPVQRGKSLVRRVLFESALPPEPAQFVATGALGAKIALGYRETLGYAFLLYGGFETTEVVTLCGLVRRGTTVVDIGANVGIFTVPLAQAVASQGAVLAFEPLQANVSRLRANLARNDIANVRVEAKALGDHEGTVELELSDDPAYGSTTEERIYKAAGTRARVPMTRLDRVWQDIGQPEISVLKVDVEGGELAVLRGAKEILGSERPAILVEAHDADQLAPIEAFLRPFGYGRYQPRGFEPWNHLFQTHSGRDAPRLREANR